MDKKLVYSIEEEKLSKEIFDLYMNSDSRSDYSSKLKNKSDALEFIEMKIEDGSVRNINHETGTNDKELSSVER